MQKVRNKRLKGSRLLMSHDNLDRAFVEIDFSFVR